jgi:hypothetical protein
VKREMLLLDITKREITEEKTRNSKETQEARSNMVINSTRSQAPEEAEG